jgi:hypothetical protein
MSCNIEKYGCIYFRVSWYFDLSERNTMELDMVTIMMHTMTEYTHPLLMLVEEFIRV